jgi:hypothetical protein
MVKIFTMVKNELDIIEDWIIYHGSMFGFNNLYIIDNESTDGTYEKIMNMKTYLPLNIFKESDYKKKGERITELIKKFAKNERFSFPLDIDEFIVIYDKNNNNIIIDKNIIIDYFNHLPEHPVYKVSFINSKITKENGYKRATVETEVGSYLDFNNYSKTFFTTKLLHNIIDHGNHYPCSDYYKTELSLVHFHCRNIDQHKEKIKNNVLGLHKTLELEKLKKIIENNPDCEGNHHVRYQINILENHFSLEVKKIEEKDISLHPLSERIKNGYF